jgi:16S rRNA (uracil1498-N3)-methyltransferase
MADRFYTPAPLAPGEFTLSGADAHHLASVRRFAPGDSVTLFNGDGCEYPAEVVSVGKREVTLHILNRQAVSRELPFPVLVASALPKGDRADYLIEKLVEVGATRFVPLVTERSVVIPKESTITKLERGVVEASKQCGRNVLMAVEPAAKVAEVVRRADLPAERWVLHTGGGGTPTAGAGGVALLIGPEGGLSAAEVADAQANGWRVATLGPRVLRVETAAVAGVLAVL